MTDRAEIVHSMQGQWAGIANVTNVAAETRKILSRRQITYRVPAVQSNAVLPESCIVQALANTWTNGFRVVEVRFTSANALTADNTNLVTVTLKKRDGAGGSASNVTTFNTAATAAGGSGNIAAFVPYVPSLTASAVECAANTVLTVTLTGAGTFNNATLGGAIVDVVVEAL
jgi:hypothetical protein